MWDITKIPKLLNVFLHFPLPRFFFWSANCTGPIKLLVTKVGPVHIKMHWFLAYGPLSLLTTLILSPNLSSKTKKSRPHHPTISAKKPYTTHIGPTRTTQVLDVPPWHQKWEEQLINFWGRRNASSIPCHRFPWKIALSAHREQSYHETLYLHFHFFGSDELQFYLYYRLFLFILCGHCNCMYKS